MSHIYYRMMSGDSFERVQFAAHDDSTARNWARTICKYGYRNETIATAVCDDGTEHVFRNVHGKVAVTVSLR